MNCDGTGFFYPGGCKSGRECPGCKHCNTTEAAANPCAVNWEPSDVPGISYGTLAEPAPGVEFMRAEFGPDVTIHARPVGTEAWELVATIRS